MITRQAIDRSCLPLFPQHEPYQIQPHHAFNETSDCHGPWIKSRLMILPLPSFITNPQRGSPFVCQLLSRAVTCHLSSDSRQPQRAANGLNSKDVALLSPSNRPVTWPIRPRVIRTCRGPKFELSQKRVPVSLVASIAGRPGQTQACW